MCLIIVKPEDVKLPKFDYLKNADEANSDGIGIAVKFHDKSRVHIKKDFKDVNALQEYLKANVKKKDILIIHFRWATSGKTDAGNRHPFPITPNKKLMRQLELKCGWAVAHNGVLTDFSGHKKYSDTQRFVMERLAHPAIKANLTDSVIQGFIVDAIGTDKLAILGEKGELILLGDFKKHDGLYFSNESYKTSQERYGFTSYPHHYYTPQYNGIVTPVQSNRSNTNSIVDETFVGECDGCGQKKSLKYVESYEDGYESYMSLCKKCRKKFKKYGLDGLMNETPREAAHEEKCDGCLKYVNVNALHPHGEFNYCHECIKDWVRLANPDSPLTAEEIISDAGL